MKEKPSTATEESEPVSRTPNLETGTLIDFDQFVELGLLLHTH